MVKILTKQSRCLQRRKHFFRSIWGFPEKPGSSWNVLQLFHKLIHMWKKFSGKNPPLWLLCCRSCTFRLWNINSILNFFGRLTELDLPNYLSYVIILLLRDNELITWKQLIYCNLNFEETRISIFRVQYANFFK